jgi:hypothetical protein
MTHGLKRLWLTAVAVLTMVTALPAAASPAACARLVSGSVKASDVKLAYGFVRDHGSCIASFGDSSFQAVAGGLTAAKLAGVISANSCSAALSQTNSPIVHSLINQVGAGVAASHLSCGCAVANSGVAERLMDIVADIRSCGEGFNPADWANDGLKAAADGFSGLGEALGIGGGGGAQGPNGGAETFNYACPVVGAWMTAGQRGPQGYCSCPAKTTQQWGNLANGGDVGSSRCVSACAKTEVYRNGVCLPCASGAGSSSGSTSQSFPDETGTQCLVSGSGYAVSCKVGQMRSADQHSCLAACAFNAVADPRTNACMACPAGTRARYSALGSSLGQCVPVVRPPTSAIAGQVNTAPAGGLRPLRPGVTSPSTTTQRPAAAPPLIFRPRPAPNRP